MPKRKAAKRATKRKKRKTEEEDLNESDENVSNENEETNNESLIKVNVGGKIFEFDKSLFDEEESYFRALLNTSVPKTYDKQGNIFVDRDPQLFEWILHLLRNPGDDRILDALRLDDAKMKLMNVELDFFGLNTLIPVLNDQTSFLHARYEEYKRSPPMKSAKYEVRGLVFNERDMSYSYYGESNSSWQKVRIDTAPLIFKEKEKLDRDPLLYNYYEIRACFGFCTSWRLGIEKNSSQNMLGSDTESFCLSSDGDAYHNEKRRSIFNISGNKIYKIGIWIDPCTASITFYLLRKPCFDRTIDMKNITFLNCELDPEAKWVVSLQIYHNVTVHVNKDAKNPEYEAQFTE